MNGLIRTTKTIASTRTMYFGENCGEDVEVLDLGRRFRTSGINRFKHVKRAMPSFAAGETHQNIGRDEESRRAKEREFERLELAIRQGSANA
jgi:hypothetical protein